MDGTSREDVIVIEIVAESEPAELVPVTLYEVAADAPVGVPVI